MRDSKAQHIKMTSDIRIFQLKIMNLSIENNNEKYFCTCILLQLTLKKLKSSRFD